jgi:calpain-7
VIGRSLGISNLSGAMGLESQSELIHTVKWHQLMGSLSEDAVIADSGAYSFGMAYCDVPDIQGEWYLNCWWL